MLNGSAEADYDRQSFGQTAGTAHVEDEQSVEVGIRGLDDVAFHFFEFGVEQGYLLDEVVITLPKRALIAEDRDTVPNVERMLDENKDLLSFISMDHGKWTDEDSKIRGQLCADPSHPRQSRVTTSVH